MSDTIDAIKAAYRAAMHRLGALEEIAFLEACLALGWRDMPTDTTLDIGLLRLAEQGSIDAAAALNILAADDGWPEGDRMAADALAALFRRNEGAREELAIMGLEILVEQAAAEIGLVCRLDPTTGEKRWYAP